MVRTLFGVMFIMGLFCWAPQSFAQPGVEAKIFEAWKKRAADTAKVSVKIEITTKTQAGFYLREPAGSSQFLPSPIEDQTTLHHYSLLLDSTTRHKIESEGPRFQSELFGNTKEYRVDVQTERGAKSMWTTSAFDEFPEMSRITIYPKKFESDKNFELLPYYLVYRPTDTDLSGERSLFRLKFDRSEVIDGKKIAVLADEVFKSVHEYWVEAEGEHCLLRVRQFKMGDAAKERTPLIDMQLHYEGVIKPGIPRLMGWRTTYTVNRPPLGARENEMEGKVVKIQLLDSIDEKEFDFKVPPIHAVSNRETNEDYLQIETGEQVPLKYSLDETPRRTVKRSLDGLKK